MSKRGKAKQDEVRIEGFRSGLDFGKARALHLLRQVTGGFDDLIKDDQMWEEVKIKDGEDSVEQTKATAEVQRETVIFCIKYLLDMWDQPGEDESPANMTDEERSALAKIFSGDEGQDNIVDFKDELVREHKDDDS
tara:strand:- start:41933 stop:42340 length:408 start_codon:yes stop_codon:yes gene_type:complete